MYGAHEDMVEHKAHKGPEAHQLDSRTCFHLGALYKRFFVRWYMRLLALHLHHVANTTKVGICGAHRLRPNLLLGLNVCHLRLMDG